MRLLLLLLGGAVRMRMMRGQHHSGVVLAQVRGSRLHLRGDVVRRGLRLKPRGRAGVGRLGGTRGWLRLRPRGGLRRAHLVD